MTAPAVTPPAVPAVQPASAEDLTSLRAEVRRIAERLDRVADEVDLLRERDETPLAWPVDVEQSTRIEVPPIEVSRGNSPAFDVLLGASRRDSA
jgi:hypothetical protein